MSVAVAVEPEVCDCPACGQGLRPFTVEHFVGWAGELELDSGVPWAVEPFQAAFVEDLFGFTRAGVPAECWLLIPEGNAKTTLVAGLTLYYLEHFPHAAIPVAAPAKETADTLYLQAEGFVTRTPRLAEEKPDLVLRRKGLEQVSPGRRKDVPRFQCQEGFRRIKFWCGGRLQIRAADERHADGIIPAGIMVLDEAHRLPHMGIYRLWSGKGEKRECPIVVISTAGEPGSEFETVRAELRQGDVVERDGCFLRSWTESSVLHEWAVPEKGDTDDLELIAEANPLSTVTVETLRRKRNKKSWNLAHWSRLTCNLPTRTASAAITDREWEAAKADDPIPEGVPVWAGLDLGWKLDTTAFVPLWVRDAEYRLFGPAKILVPPRNGNMLESSKLKEAVREIHARNPVETVVMDMSNGAETAEWLQDELGCTVIDRSQTNSFKALDYARFTEALREGWLRHAGDPGLTRHVMNAVAKQLPGGDIVFARPHDSRRSVTLQDSRVIDALVAAAMVHTAASDGLGNDGTYVYAYT